MFTPVTPHSKAEKHLLMICGGVFFFFLLLDQLTKLFTISFFKLNQSLVLIPGWFNFTYVRNTGAAWSMFSGFPWLLLIFGVAAGAAILIFFRRWSETFPERYLSLALIESGIIGNSIDRLWHGAVIDFIHLHYFEYYHYPIFNIADCAICVGVFIFIISNFCRKSPEKCKS